VPQQNLNQFTCVVFGILYILVPCKGRSQIVPQQFLNQIMYLCRVVLMIVQQIRNMTFIIQIQYIVERHSRIALKIMVYYKDPFL
jgi:hypothetical protein